MPTDIRSLPEDIVDIIQQYVMTPVDPAPTAEPTPPAQQHAPLTSEQAARRAAAARASFPVLNSTYYAVDKRSLSLKKNGDIGCAVTENTIRNLAGEPAEKFEERLRELFKWSTNIQVDVGPPLSTEQARTVLRVLQEMVLNGASVPLHNVKFKTDLECASPALLRDIDATITAIRQTENGKEASFDFACSSHHSARKKTPDFSALANLTSVDLSDCFRLTATPDFKNNRKLKSVNLSGCFRLRVAPDFSENPELRSVNLSWCSLLEEALDFSKNPELRSVNLSWCSSLPAAIVGDLRNVLGDRLIA